MPYPPSPPSLQSPANSSFPNPLPTSDYRRASSVISSQVTDIGSEDGDEFRTGDVGSGLRPGTAASTEPNRPGSALSSHTRQSTRTPISRRGLGSPGSLNTLRAGGTSGLGSPVTDGSRPGSAMSKTSRTHVPSLASHAFFRPMSSQRLQAQRAARPSRGHSSVGGDGTSDTGSNTRRHSLATSATDMQEHPFRPQNDVPPPPTSRGTYHTEEDERTTVNASPEGKSTLRSLDGSARPLQQSMYVNIGDEPDDGSTPRSKRGFSANFMRTAHKEAQGPASLASQTESPVSNSKPYPPTIQIGSNYQYFLGNTIFCWGGRLQNTRGRPINIASFIFVILPVILFLVYSGHYLSKHASPAVPFFFAYLAFVCVSSFVHASSVDPGILPRNLHPLPPPESEDPLAVPPPLTQWTMVKSAGTENAAMDVPTKYCKTCNIWRPPRCHHCRVCDNCIENQDHHCVWINNCVGRRNYRYFFAFVSSATLLGFYLIFASLGQCLHYASSNHISFAESIDINRVPFAMVIYGIIATVYPACLWGYHLWLIARGETTREYLNSHKFLKKDRHRPFTQGNIFKNWAVALLRPRTPTYLQFKAPYQEGDQRFGSRRHSVRFPFLAERQPRGMEMQHVNGAKNAH